MSLFQTKEFRKLQREWYARLKKEGFQDVEIQRGSTQLLKAWDSSRFAFYFGATDFLARQLYYQLAGQFYHSHHFGSSKEKAIWALHAEGFSYKEIQKITSITLYQIRRVVPALRARMLEAYKEAIEE